MRDRGTRENRREECFWSFEFLALFAVSTVTAGSIASPTDGGKEVKNLSSKGLTHFIPSLGRGGERLWGRCLGGEVDETPRQLTVVKPSGSVMELIVIAVFVAADVTKSSLANSQRASFFSKRAIL
jgi:hypothetical protein